MKASSIQRVDKIGPCATRTHDQFLKRQVVRRLQPADRARIRDAALPLIFLSISRISGRFSPQAGRAIPSVGPVQVQP